MDKSCSSKIKNLVTLLHCLLVLGGFCCIGMSQKDLIVKFFFAHPTGKRLLGCPRTRWMSYLSNWLGLKTCLEIEVVELAVVAPDH